MSRRLTTLERIIKTGAVNFVRNAWLSVAAIAMMLITLTIVLFLVITNATFANSIKQITDKIDISVYLKDSVTPEQRTKLISDLRNLPNVSSIGYKSKDQALEDYKKQNADDLELLLAISQTDNYLPASLTIKPADPNHLQSIKDFVEKPDVKALQAYKTSYSDDLKKSIDNITTSTRFVRQAASAGVILFALISMLIIFNTIQMAIFNRREELTIMRLLGANTWYIRGPFVVETMIYGIIAALVSVAVVNGVFAVFTNAFKASSIGLLDLSFANRYFANHFGQILLAQLMIGILIGTISSVIATRRYLRFKNIR